MVLCMINLLKTLVNYKYTVHILVILIIALFMVIIELFRIIYYKYKYSKTTSKQSIICLQFNIDESINDDFVIKSNVDEIEDNKEFISIHEVDDIANDEVGINNTDETKNVISKELIAVKESEEEPIKISTRYKNSFVSRLSLAHDDVKDRYCLIYNYLLSYNKVKVRSSWNYVSFIYGKITLARINVHYKTIDFYCSLIPEDLTKIKFTIEDVSDKKSTSNIPTLLKVKSNRAVNNVLKLIDLMVAKYQIVKKENFENIIQPEDFPYQSRESLVKKGKIRTTTIIKSNKKVIYEKTNVNKIIVDNKGD